MNDECEWEVKRENGGKEPESERFPAEKKSILSQHQRQSGACVCVAARVGMSERKGEIKMIETVQLPFIIPFRRNLSLLFGSRIVIQMYKMCATAATTDNNITSPTQRVRARDGDPSKARREALTAFQQQKQQ